LWGVWWAGRGAGKLGLADGARWRDMRFERGLGDKMGKSAKTGAVRQGGAWSRPGRAPAVCAYRSHQGFLPQRAPSCAKRTQFQRVLAGRSRCGGDRRRRRDARRAKQTVRQGKLVQFSRYESCPAKVSRPAGIDVVVSGGNEWCEALRIADGQPQRK